VGDFSNHVAEGGAGESEIFSSLDFSFGEEEEGVKE
jgi:hypothetical protein